MNLMRIDKSLVKSCTGHLGVAVGPCGGGGEAAGNGALENRLIYNLCYISTYYMFATGTVCTLYTV